MVSRRSCRLVTDVIAPVVVCVAFLFIAALGLAAPRASGEPSAALEFADWTAISGNAATGTLLGKPVSLSGTHVFGTPTSVLDGSWPFFAGPDFSPALLKTDIIQVGSLPGSSYTLQFGAPISDPILHVGSLGSRLDFSSGTQIAKVSGDGGFTVSGAAVSGTARSVLGPDGINDANGTVRLSGTFSSISFTTTPLYSGPEDGVLVQVGAAAPVAPAPSPGPTPTSPPPPGGLVAPAPRIVALRPAGTTGGGRSLVTAQLAGKVSRLQWFVNGGRRPVLTSDPAQNTLRLRPSSAGTIVSVRAIGPGGLSPFDRVQIPKLVAGSGRTARRVDAVAGSRPVWAAGVLSSLDGKAQISCAALRPVRISAEAGLLDVKGGCLQPLAELGQLPDRMRGIVVDMAKQYGIPLDLGSANLGLERSDAYMSFGEVSVNGVSVDPGSGAVVIFPQIHRIAASNATVSVGSIKLGGPRRFELDTTPRHGVIPFGSFPALPGKDLVPGFGVFGNVSLTAVPAGGGRPAGAAITAQLRLPSWLSVAGVQADATVDLRATTDAGVVLNSMRTRVKDVNVGPVQVKRFQLTYTREASGGLPGDRWEGQGVACLPPAGPCIDMAPPRGGVRIIGGHLDFVGASFLFNPPAPLFTGLKLSRIGFGFGLDPTRFLVTTLKVVAADLITIDGRAVVAFPSNGQPYRLSHDAAFLDDPPPAPRRFPPVLYDDPHKNFTIAANAQAALQVPVLGEVSFGNAYFVYEYPAYVAFGGGINEDVLGVATFTGGVNGEINAVDHRFDIHGEVRTCLGDCPDGAFALKYGGDVHFSDIGASACVRPPVLPDFGVGVYWPGRFPRDWRFQGPGCRWSPFRDANVHARGAHAAKANLPYTFTVHRGDPGVNVRLTSNDGAPRVRVIGPAGHVLESPAHDGVVGGEQLMIFHFNRPKITSVGMRHAVPGTYRIEALPGSPPVSDVATATEQPPAQIRAAVHGGGLNRVLSYRIGRRAGQRVKFLETTAGGAARELATVTRAGRGSVRFTTTPGVGRRTIVAQFELARLPAERLTVARFQPASPRLGSVSRLRVMRRGTSIRATWARVQEATAYELVLTTTGAGQRRLRSRRPSMTVPKVSKATGGRVSVRAVGVLRQGPIANAGFRATAHPVTRLRLLPPPPRLG